MSWNADTYHRISAPQQAWAAEQFERLALQPDEIVLDAGCGSGKVTAQLNAAKIYAVDGDANMVEHARAELDGRATVLHQDLVELDLPEQVDVIFSNATFHWIKDHEALFRALYRALKPGGRLVAQCGGKGNIDSLRRVAEQVAADAGIHVAPWNYADVSETEARLHAAGFSDVKTWLEPKPTTPPAPREFLSTVCLLPYLSELPEGEREGFI
ncbi:MAG: methyltransferase domain-containing protein, partial [Solirubrobacterales bacterium]|nr:methyltransferase domain-containing protein [Solirubrobacterales bacterium]